MKYSYPINAKPDEVEKLMRSNVSELSLRIRLAETLLPAKVQAGIYGKVQNGTFDFVNFKAYSSPNRTIIPRSMAFLHMKGNIVDTNIGSIINFRFAFSVWYFMIRIAFALFLCSIWVLIKKTAGFEIIILDLKAITVIAALTFIVPTIFDVIFGLRLNKKSKQELLDFMMNLLDVDNKKCGGE